MKFVLHKRNKYSLFFVTSQFQCNFRVSIRFCAKVCVATNSNYPNLKEQEVLTEVRKVRIQHVFIYICVALPPQPSPSN